MQCDAYTRECMGTDVVMGSEYFDTSPFFTTSKVRRPLPFAIPLHLQATRHSLLSHIWMLTLLARSKTATLQRDPSSSYATLTPKAKPSKYPSTGVPRSNHSPRSPPPKPILYLFYTHPPTHPIYKFYF